MTNESPPTSSTFLDRWGAAAVRHRRYVLAAWLLGIPLLGAFALAVNQGVVSSLTIPGAESQEAVDLLEEAFPQRSGDYGDLVFRASNGLDDLATRDAIESLSAEAAAIPGVVSVQSPYAPGGLVSEDGTVGIARVQFAEPADDVDAATIDALLDRADVARSDSLEVEFGGPVAVAQEREGPSESTALGLIASLVILYILFRAIVPTVLPIGTAMLGLVSGFALIFSMTALVDLSKFGPTIAAMLGLGVGIDYALFIVARHRENLGRGMSPEVAAGRALSTAGKAVIFAGGVVITSLLGLSFMGIPFVGWIGVASAIMVALAVLVAVTLLPALLGFAGRHARPRQAVSPDHDHDEHHSRSPWYRLGYAIMRRPYAFFGLSALILLVLAIPALDIRLGSADAGNNPTTSTARRAYDITAEAFGAGANGPLQVVVDGAPAPEVDALREAVAATPGVAAVTPPVTSPDGRISLFSVVPLSAPQDAATTDLVHTLRNDVIPTASPDNSDVYVSGTTARYIDIADRISDRLPIFFSIVIGVSLVLLTMVFRSVVIALKAALMNLLSIGAAYGVVVAVFQWGWGIELTGADKTGPIESFLPMMLFAVLFGLSMDYEVFLVSRIREEYLRTGDNARSVARGLAATASVITAAASIMIVVFLSFVLNDQRVVKEFGLGLAVAIFVDATVVRLILVPSTMRLMGNWNWWLPAWLDRALPRISIEGAEDEEPAAVTEPGTVLPVP